MNCFVVWLTDERHLALFPAGTIVKDPHHLESPIRCKQENWDMTSFVVFILKNS